MDSVQSGEVQSLVCTPRPTSATGNGLSGNLKTFGDMRMHSQISVLCDLMSWKKIKTYDYFITKPSLQDGHGGVDTQCKEYTFSRSDHRSRIHCRIPGGTKIGPVIDIKVVQIIGVHGIEIAVPSMRDDSRTSWVLITRGKNRFFDELEDPSVSPHVPSSNLLKQEAESKEANTAEKDYKSSWQQSSDQNPSSSSRIGPNPVQLEANPMCFTKRTMDTQKRMWKTIPNINGTLGVLSHREYRGWCQITTSLRPG